MIRLAACLAFCMTAASADVIVAARTIPAKTVIAAEDLLMRDISAPGAAIDPNLVIGKEARVALFAGRPIYDRDVGVPAVVERNQVIPLIYEGAGLMIKTEGRALERAGPGDVIRVMNTQSRTTVSALIDEGGLAHVAR